MEFPEQNKKGKKYLKNQVKLTKEQIRNPELRMVPLSEHLSKCAKSSSKKFIVYYIIYFPEDQWRNGETCRK